MNFLNPDRISKTFLKNLESSLGPMILGPACAHSEAQKWRQEAECHYPKMILKILNLQCNYGPEKACKIEADNLKAILRIFPSLLKPASKRKLNLRQTLKLAQNFL